MYTLFVGLQGDAHENVIWKERHMDHFAAVGPPPYLGCQRQQYFDSLPVKLCSNGLLMPRTRLDGVPLCHVHATGNLKDIRSQLNDVISCTHAGLRHSRSHPSVSAYSCTRKLKQVKSRVAAESGDHRAAVGVHQEM